MASLKHRLPDMDEPESLLQFDRVSKATWADLFYDLYRQVSGEQTPESVIRADVDRRASVLAAGRATVRRAEAVTDGWVQDGHGGRVL